MKGKLVVVLAIMLFGISQAQTKKPNILVIWGDDIGWSNPSIYNMGMMGYKTPNIDKIEKMESCLPIIIHSKVVPLGVLLS